MTGGSGSFSRRWSLRSLVVDVAPLRDNRDFRWLFVGQIGAQLLRHLLVVAVPYEVFVHTGSSLLVGMVGLVQVIPLIAFALIGGTAADAHDRRRLLIAVQVLLSATSVGLALNTHLQAGIWPIFVLVAVNAGLAGVESPTRTAIIPSLVPQAQLPSALALNQTLNQTTQVVGPALGGLLMARFGVAAAYWIASAAGLLTALALLPLAPSRPAGAAGRLTLGALVEGWRFLRRVPLLQHTMLIDLDAMVLGMPRALFPAFGTVVLGGDAATVGLLYAAPGAGAFLGAVTTGWVSAVRHQGRAVVAAVVAWGLAITGFGLSRSLPLALVLLALAGAADVVSNVFRTVILQTATPDGLLGRIGAFKTSLTGAGPHLGDARAGAMAALVSPTFSVVSGGLACIAGAVLLGWKGRALWEQRSDHVQPLPQRPASPA